MRGKGEIGDMTHSIFCYCYPSKSAEFLRFNISVKSQFLTTVLLFLLKVFTARMASTGQAF